MANTLKTRILNKISTWAEWESVKTTFKPLRGEICIVEIPSGTTSTGLTPPATGIKVGDGQHVFGELPWIQAVAGDVTAWCKENMADYDTFKAQVDKAVADSEGALQDAIDALAERVASLEGIVKTGDNSNAKLREAITATNNVVAGHTTELASLTTNKADKTQVAADIAAAKTAVLGQTDSKDFEGTVKGAYEAAATAKDAADAAAEAAATNLQTAKTYTDAAETRVLGKNDDGSNFTGTVKGAYANAATAQSTANTNAADIVTIKSDIEEINEKIGGDTGTSIIDRLDALEASDEAQDGKIKNNEDAIKAEKERAEGIEAGLRTDVNKVLTFFDVDPAKSDELVDTLRELQEYIASDESGAATMAENIQKNAKAISDEADRAKKAEADLQDNIDDVKTKLLGANATYGTDSISTVKKLAEDAGKAASDNLVTAKAYTDTVAEGILGEKGYSGTVKGAYAAAATADQKAVNAQTAADNAQTAADNAQDSADEANTAIAGLLGSSVSEANGKISTISFSNGKLTATRKDITMADMSATDVFIFDCGSALVNADNLSV